jgi:hypothetical protein
MDSGFALLARPGMTMKNCAWDRLVRPTGKSVRLSDCGVSISRCKNISLVPSDKSVALIPAFRAERGALANVINAERDAVDADALSDERC